MSNTAVFDNAARSFGRPFSEAEIWAKVSTDPDWSGSKSYFDSIIRDRIKKEILIEERGLFVLGPGLVIGKKSKEAPTINPDLPMGVTITNGIIDITHENAVLIREKILHHPAYAYTRFVEKAFLSTKPKKPKKLTVEDAIHRLVIINQIDGINLDLSFGTGCFDAIAKSIIDTNLESIIANPKHPEITNDVFRSIAIRHGSDCNPGDEVKLFSGITKYIARTAQYVYGFVDGFPIYDSVLGDTLELYIPGINIGRLLESCDYETYRRTINSFLSEINKTSKKHVSNIDFDQIVWFSYKKKNSPQRFE